LKSLTISHISSIGFCDPTIMIFTPLPHSFSRV
jgi:hypothetical protein